MNFLKNKTIQFVIAWQLLGLLLLLPIPGYGRTNINTWLEQNFGPFCLKILQNAFPNHAFYSGFFTDSPNLNVLLFLGSVFFVLLALLLVKFLKSSQSHTFNVLLTALRYYLAWIFLLYGFSKIFGIQFPNLNPANIDFVSQDKGLHFWIWMSQRPILVKSIGCIEVIVATTLFFKKIRKIGLLLYLFSSSVILLINLFFDIDVKILAALLVCSAAFLLLILKDESAIHYRSESSLKKLCSKHQNQVLSLKLFIVLLLYFSTIWSNLH